MKYLTKGFANIFIALLILPIGLPLMIIDFLYIFGGCDPFNTPISKIKDRIGNLFF